MWRRCFFPARCAVCGEPLETGEREHLHALPDDGSADGLLARGGQSRGAQVLGTGPRRAGLGLPLLRPRQRLAETDPRLQVLGIVAHGAGDGRMVRRCLAESGLYGGVEVSLPLPLHPIKRCRRGYNQSEYIAEGSPPNWGVPVDRHSVRRRRNTESQARSRTANGPGMSKGPLRCGIRTAGGGAISCWSTT